jgi:hypothetical protein
MRLRLVLTTLALTAFFAVSASAAPDFNGALSAEKPTYEWDGTGSGVSEPLLGSIDCTAPAAHDCDDVLLKLEAPGDLTIELKNSGGVEVPEATGQFGGGNIASLQDVDFNVYRSDASGAPQGDTLTEDGATTYVSEKATVKNLAPGFYLVRVDYFLAAEASYKGIATLATQAGPTPTPTAEATPTPTPTATPTAPPTAQPQEQAAPAKPQQAAKRKASKRAACVKKAKKIKNAKKRKVALRRCPRR